MMQDLPEKTCDEASVQFDLLREAGRISLAALLMVMSHLAHDDIPHEASCRYHRAGALEHVRRRFNEIMNGEA